MPPCIGLAALCGGHYCYPLGRAGRIGSGGSATAAKDLGHVLPVGRPGADRVPGRRVDEFDVGHPGARQCTLDPAAERHDAGPGRGQGAHRLDGVGARRAVGGLVVVQVDEDHARGIDPRAVERLMEGPGA